MWKIIGLTLLSLGAVAAPAIVKAVKKGRQRQIDLAQANVVELMDEDTLLDLYAREVYKKQQQKAAKKAIDKIAAAAHVATHGGNANGSKSSEDRF